MKGKENVFVQEFEQVVINRDGIKAVATVRVVTTSKRPLRQVEAEVFVHVTEAR